MTRGLFTRIFLLYAVVIVAGMVVAETFIVNAVRESHLDTLTRDVTAHIDLIARHIAFDQRSYDSLTRELKQDTGARVTIISADGSVLGDSDFDTSRMDNHLKRTEVERASLYGTGTYIRYSDTVKTDFLYVAKKIEDGRGVRGFVRLAVPLKEIDDTIFALKVKISLTLSIVLMLTWIVAWWQIDRLRRLLGQITNFSKSLARGELDKRLHLHNAGEFSEIVDNLTSMSERLQGVIALSEEERNRLAVILKSIPDGLLIIDVQGVIVLASASCAEFFGKVSLVGRQFAEHVRSNEFSDLLREVRKNLAPGMRELKLDEPVEKYLSVKVSPLFYRKDEFSGFVAIFNDITQMKRLEEMRKDFVANVSHEIKTPITAIKGFADTLLEGALDDKDNATRFVATIKSNSERINSIVDDLMIISKIELGVMRISKSGVSIDEVVENVRDSLRAKAMAKHIDLRTACNPEIPKIDADKNRLIQILTNLVDNAIKFTESGRVTFGIDMQDGERFLFVDDTGIGIPQGSIARLGERFYRLDPGRSRKMGGTGLGLAIVKHLVKAHGWDMRIESAVNKGTMVKIIIPVHHDTAA